MQNFNVNGLIQAESINRLMDNEISAGTGNNVFLIKGKENNSSLQPGYDNCR